MWAASLSRPVGAGEKVRLIDGVEQHYRRLLHDLILQRRNRDRSLLSVLFRYIDSAQRLGTVRLALQLLPEPLDILCGLLRVVLVRDFIHPGTGVLSQTAKCRVQLLGREQVSHRAKSTSA